MIKTEPSLERNRGLNLAFVDEFDMVCRIDHSYFRSLIDLYRSVHGLEPVMKDGIARKEVKPGTLNMEDTQYVMALDLGLHHFTMPAQTWIIFFLELCFIQAGCLRDPILQYLPFQSIIPTDSPSSELAAACQVRCWRALLCTQDQTNVKSWHKCGLWMFLDECHEPPITNYGPFQCSFHRWAP